MQPGCQETGRGVRGLGNTDIGAKFLVLLNFTSATSKADTGFDLSKAKVLINNYDKPTADGSLRLYEAVVYEL